MQAARTAQAGTPTCIHDTDRTRNGPFPKPAPIVLPMTRFGETKPAFDIPLTNSVRDLIHNQYRFFVLQ